MQEGADLFRGVFRSAQECSGVRRTLQDCTIVKHVVFIVGRNTEPKACLLLFSKSPLKWVVKKQKTQDFRGCDMGVA